MPSNSQPGDVYYSMVAGDTLSKIAANYYGLAVLWPLIQKANPEIASDPNRLPAGTRLRIPGPPEIWQRQSAVLESSRVSYAVISHYSGTDEQVSGTPFLIPPLPVSAHFSTEIQVPVNQVYRSPGDPAAIDSLENDDFYFRWSPENPRQAKNAAEVAALVTIKANNAWKSGADAREALQANFDDFFCRLEAFELSHQGLAPGGAEVIRQQVAEAIPAPSGETLFYRYGLNPGLREASSPYVDLLPGMRVRIEFSSNQFVAPGSALNGLVGSGQFFYGVQLGLDGRLSFDSFLASIAAPEIDGGASRLVSDVLGLQAAGRARRHYRVFYPSQLAPDSSPGAAGLEQNVTLIGADTLADLRAASEAYTHSRELGAASEGLPVTGIAFRGRAALIPEIRVTVSRSIDTRTMEQSIYVPLGTTLRQLLDGIVPNWNPNALYVRQVGTYRPVILWRLHGDNSGLPYYRQVLIKPSAADYYPDPAALDLPLVGGDDVVLALATSRQPA